MNFHNNFNFFIKKILLDLNQLALIFTTVGLILFLNFKPPIKPSSFIVKLDHNQQLVGEIYLPNNQAITKPYPTMIITHGINSSKETMTPLALELARHGVAAITFDFGNYGESSKRQLIQDIQEINLLETEAIVNYLKQFPDLFDQNKIGIGGHSMGGSVALDCAKIHPEMKTTILLAIGGEATPESPQNLLYAMGLYDELNPTWSIKNYFLEAINHDLKDELNSGNFHQGNGRKLVFSGRSDHFIAPYDGSLISEVVAWILQAFDLTIKAESSMISGYIIGMMLIFLGGSLGIGFLVDKIPILSQKQTIINLGYLILVGLVFRLNNQQIINPTIASNILLFLLFSQWLVNYRLFQQEAWQTHLKILVTYGIILSFSFLISAAIPNGLPEIIKHPRYLLELPLFFIQWLFLILYNLTQHLKKQVFVYYTIDLLPSYQYFIVLILITFFHNFFTQKISNCGTYLLAQIRQPLKITGVGKISRKLLLLIIGLLLILGITLYHQGQKGLISEAINRGFDGIKLLIQMLLIPCIIFLGILRSRYLEKIIIKFCSK